MTHFSIVRTGSSPLTFDGELLSSSEGRSRHGQDHNRWHNISVYRTKGGNYVVAVEYRSTLNDEEHCSTVVDCKEPSEVVEVLRSYDPEEGVQMPGVNDPSFDPASAKTLRDLRRRFEVQVSEVLADHPEFAERID